MVNYIYNLVSDPWSWFQLVVVLHSLFHAPGSMFLAPCLWFHAPGSTLLVPRSWFHAPGSIFLVPHFWVHTSGSTPLGQQVQLHCSPVLGQESLFQWPLSLPTCLQNQLTALFSILYLGPNLKCLKCIKT